jgi:glutaconate CoA-transferase subunit B
MADQDVVDFLAVAARCVPDRGWVFAGFNWPVLACQTARALGRQVTEVYEAGAAVDDSPDSIPSSTTDYFAYQNQVRWRGSTLDVLALIPRLDVVLLDAAQVDVYGRINTFGVGGPPAPTFRSAGGGGAADAAARAKRLVLLHGGHDVARIRQAVDHVTAAPAPGAEVTLVTRWGTARLDGRARVIAQTNHPDAAAFARCIAGSGDPPVAPRSEPVTDVERDAALAVLSRAAQRGYRTAARAVEA